MNDIDKCHIRNYDDAEGNPAGGRVEGTGLYISWQNGPLGRGEARKEPNGAFVETVIAAAIQRLEYYQRCQYDYLQYSWEWPLQHSANIVTATYD